VRPEESAEQALRSVRSCIARTMLGAASPDVRLGDVTLHPHQKQALSRIQELLARDRVAVLADETGLGKTYVALAAARAYERVLIITPASLRSLWSEALLRIQQRADIISLELLSRRGSAGIARPTLMIVDEAHHLRTTATRRYGEVAALCDSAVLLLLTATPVQNRRGDLVALLALRLGDAASSMTDEELARHVVRRSSGEIAHFPALDGPHWIRPPMDDDVLDALRAMPSPLPASDEGSAGELVVYSLLRQWASSRAALVAALRRRIARATAMRASLESGRWPSRRELAAWSCVEDAVQLALPELISPPRPLAVRAHLTQLLDAVGAHERALGALLHHLRTTPDPDPDRAAAVRCIRTRHAGARIIAFSQFAATVHGLGRLLAPDGGVAELTARGARIVTGRTTREDVLAQFAPAFDARHVPPAERITLLVATDVLSEGLDLHAASVIVHLDLPWNPARLEQRVGRVRRLGSTHETVHVYAFAPPASSERVLRVEQRLRAKLRIARGMIGLGGYALPHSRNEPDARGPPEIASDTLACLEQWRSDMMDTVRPSPGAYCAAVLAPCAGLVALLNVEGRPLLVADLGRGVTADARSVSWGVRALAGEPVAIEQPEITCALASLGRWWASRRGRRTLALGSARGARVRRRLTTKIAALLAATPRHDLARVAALASRAQMLTRAPLGACGERALESLARAPRADEPWLKMVAALGESRSLGTGAAGQSSFSGSPSEMSVLALVVLRAADGSMGAPEP